MSSFEPPSSRFNVAINRFYIIPDHRGHYTVRDEFHLHGGYFINRIDARKYALSENGNKPDLIIELPPSISPFFREASLASALAAGALNTQNRSAAG